jgi:hypothetical protein
LFGAVLAVPSVPQGCLRASLGVPMCTARGTQKGPPYLRDLLFLMSLWGPSGCSVGSRRLFLWPIFLISSGNGFQIYRFGPIGSVSYFQTCRGPRQERENTNLQDATPPRSRFLVKCFLDAWGRILGGFRPPDPPGWGGAASNPSANAEGGAPTRGVWGAGAPQDSAPIPFQTGGACSRTGSRSGKIYNVGPETEARKRVSRWSPRCPQGCLRASLGVPLRTARGTQKGPPYRSDLLFLGSLWGPLGCSLGLARFSFGPFS